MQWYILNIPKSQREKWYRSAAKTPQFYVFPVWFVLVTSVRKGSINVSVNLWCNMLQNNIIAARSTRLWSILIQFFAKAKNKFSIDFQIYLQFYALKSLQKYKNLWTSKIREYFTLIIRLFLINKLPLFLVVFSFDSFGLFLDSSNRLNIQNSSTFITIKKWA